MPGVTVPELDFAFTNVLTVLQGSLWKNGLQRISPRRLQPNEMDGF